MMLHKRYRKVLLVIVPVIVVIVLALNFGLSWYLKKKIPTLINKPGSEYHLAFEDIDISLIRGSFHADKVSLVPSVSVSAKDLKAGMYVSIPSLDITGIDILPILYSNRISAKALILSKPVITIVKSRKSDRDDPKKIKKEVTKPFQRLIAIANVQCKNASIKMTYTNKEIYMDVYNLSARFGKFEFSKKTMSNKLPFSYGEYEFHLDSMRYHPDAVYHLHTGKISTVKNKLTVETPEYLCDISRPAFEKQLETERDIYNIKARRISIRKLDFGFKNDTIFFHPDRLLIENPSANIYRDKRVADDPRKKALYNTLLRKVPFDLRIDTLAIRNALIEYEEQLTAVGPGKIKFDRFNLTATHVYSAFHRKKMEDMKIAVDCRFMETSPLKVKWRLNVLDESDGFNIRGSILNFDAGAMSPFTKPYINVETEGILQEIYFNINGNDKISNGAFAMKYDDFHVKVFRKHDRKKKNKLLTAIGNLFAKDDSKGHVKTVKVDVDRKQDRSFYNFLWRNIAEGLKKTLL